MKAPFFVVRVGYAGAVMTRVSSIHMWAAMREGAGRIGRASVVSESGRMKSERQGGTGMNPLRRFWRYLIDRPLT